MSVADVPVYYLRYIGHDAGKILMEHGLYTVGDLMDLYKAKGQETFYETIANILHPRDYFPNRYLLTEIKQMIDIYEHE